jgi:Domain of unknown function (DUF4158)
LRESVSGVSVQPDARGFFPLSKNPLAGGGRNRRFFLGFGHAITVCLKTIVFSQEVSNALAGPVVSNPTQRVQVLALPTSLREYEDLYTLTPTDLEFVAAHRTDANRLGAATQLCFLRHPGRAWTPDEVMPAAMLRFIALQIDADPADLDSYAERDQTRREHAVEVMREYGFTAFGVKEYRTLLQFAINTQIAHYRCFLFGENAINAQLGQCPAAGPRVVSSTHWTHRGDTLGGPAFSLRTYRPNDSTMPSMSALRTRTSSCIRAGSGRSSNAWNRAILAIA